MSVLPLIFPLCFTLAAQFLLWFNLLFPYNLLFEGFNRTSYMIFSVSAFFVACISLVFYRMLAFENLNKTFFTVAVILQFLSLFSSVFFFASALTGLLVFL
ncbi:MAG: hypothetical protein FWB90_06430 [Fibromonadales bacterium]|nr:hypothetical protein [Fibromonadales bacterium]